jgi:histidinol-phosphate aminotransferase
VPNYLSKKAKSITPYTAGAQPKVKNIIKLNTNENPYPPSPATLEAHATFDAAALRLYPRPDGGKLRSAIAHQYGLDISNVFCGNGSDEVLGFAFDAFFDGDIMFPDITYSFYPVWADLFNISYKLLPLADDFTIPIKQLKANGIVLANPNAPTGIAVTLDDIELVLNNNKDYVVIVDEAYAAFGAPSAVPLISKYPNLLVVNTLSKSHCLAGLRIGYALGQPHLIDALVRIKDSFNSYPLDSLAQKIASAALNDTQYYDKIAKKIIATRERISASLADLEFSVLPSCANFVFVSHKSTDAKQLKAYLEQNAIFVRHFDLPRISNHLRITIGTDDQMDALLVVISKFLSNH